MILVFDENMPPRLAEALQALGSCEARHVLKSLPRGSPDADVFTLVSDQGGILITQDHKIRRRPHELRALQSARIGVFILTGRAQRNVEELMAFLLQALPQIRELAQSTAPPYVYGIPDRGKIEKLV